MKGFATFPAPRFADFVVGPKLTLEDIVDLEDEALAETGNIILNSWIATIANLLKHSLRMSLPPGRARRQPPHVRELGGARQANPVSAH
jgi:hypothetical protein